LTQEERRLKILSVYTADKASCTIDKISKETGVAVKSIYKLWNTMIEAGIDLPELPYMQIYDMDNIKKTYVSYKQYRETMKQAGVRRLPNMPEYISEGLVAVLYNGIDSQVGDIKILDREVEVKSTTMLNKDCTSFSPNNRNKDVYFICFNLETDSYKIYVLQASVIDDCYTNKNQTVKETREKGQRPRISLFKYIKNNNIQPDKTGVL
jgi:hypothetical protein